MVNTVFKMFLVLIFILFIVIGDLRTGWQDTVLIQAEEACYWNSKTLRQIIKIFCLFLLLLLFFYTYERHIGLGFQFVHFDVIPLSIFV